MKIKINNREIDCEAGDTVLSAALRAGIKVPYLCAFDLAPTPHASCRICAVEVEGEKRLQTSCTLAVREGMSVHTHTPRVLRLRRNVVELLLASHPDECLHCERNGDCELSRLASVMEVRGNRFGGGPKGHQIDISSPSIVRDPNKCVLCGRCVTMCHEEQGVGAIDFSGRGFKSRVSPGADKGLSVSDCVFCGQCVRVCPTGALREKSAVADVTAALGDPSLAVVAQVAPAVPATLAAELGLKDVEEALRLVAGALRQIGFSAVFDTSFAADLTTVEEAHELVERIKNGGPLPMFTSCSPAWVRFVELHRPELIPNLSTCKSPQQMVAALIKEREEEIGKGKRIYSVSIMPCTAKKLEAAEQGDIDAVLTTRELSRLFRTFGLGDKLADVMPAELDAPFAEASGAGRLFGGSGGVLEAALRTAAHMLGAPVPVSPAAVASLREPEHLRMAVVSIGEHRLRCGVVSGLGAARELLDRLASGRDELDFIEVMACAGGCIGGGGQPRTEGMRAPEERRKKIHEADQHAKLHLAHENPTVKRMYAEFLGEPGSAVSHRLLHRKYAGDGNE